MNPLSLIIFSFLAGFTQNTFADSTSESQRSSLPSSQSARQNSMKKRVRVQEDMQLLIKKGVRNTLIPLGLRPPGPSQSAEQVERGRQNRSEVAKTAIEYKKKVKSGLEPDYKKRARDNTPLENQGIYSVTGRKEYLKSSHLKK